MELIPHLLPPELPRLDLRGVADILIVAGLIYWLLLIIKDTTAVMLVRGLAILVLWRWSSATLPTAGPRLV